MKRRTTIALFYTGIALISAAILALAFYLNANRPKPERPVAVNLGKETGSFEIPITQDLEATNQDGTKVRLSDLRGKVWVVAEFFAVCPKCALRNGGELRKLYEEFRKHPDFHIVCITVDPENDDQEKLAAYAKALGADTSDWWFLNAGSTQKTHEYLEQEMKFFRIRERTDPVDIQSNGKYEHDMGFLLVDREHRIIGKWPLSDAGSEEAMKTRPGEYERLKNDMFGRIRAELEKNETPGI